ncbi:vitamin D-binding protein isoform X2 [Lepisosteus oculatus]
MVKLADKCCAEEASPDCYDNVATKMSEISCGKDSPFPKHPEICKCCGEKGLERKLCLAALRVTSEELPSLQESSNDEICKQFKQDPKGYSLRYIYEFARRHGSIPAGLVLNATDSYLKMVGACCSPSVSQICFLRERLQQKDSNHNLRIVSNLCHNHIHLKSFKIGLTTYYGQIMNGSFEEVSPIASYLQEGLSNCCLDPQPDCLMKKLTGFKTVLCSASAFINHSKLQKCCSKTHLNLLTCVGSLDVQIPPQSTESEGPLKTDLCKNASIGLEKYLFEIGRRHYHVSVPVLASVFADIKKIVDSCCSAGDVSACIDDENKQLKEIENVFSKTDEVCQKYKTLNFTDFKKMMLQSVQEETSKSNKNVVDTKVQQWVDFASTCCSQMAPALQCRKLIDLCISGIKEDSSQ